MEIEQETFTNWQIRTTELVQQNTSWTSTARQGIADNLHLRKLPHLYLEQKWQSNYKNTLSSKCCLMQWYGMTTSSNVWSDQPCSETTRVPSVFSYLLYGEEHERDTAANANRNFKFKQRCSWELESIVFNCCTQNTYHIYRTLRKKLLSK